MLSTSESHEFHAQFDFKLSGRSVKTVDRYKYLGIFANEYINYDIIAHMLAESGGRALGAISN